MRRLIWMLVLVFGTAHGAETVPNEVQMPGTQPGQLGKFDNDRTFDSAKQCSYCHAGYDKGTEPGHNWQGSMMSHAARDPLFWSTLAVAEQDFDGSGDLCIRCHVSGGWLSGRSVPTDGSALIQADANGIECDTCHRMTNPDGSEHKGVQTWPFIANDEGSPAVGNYGSAQYVMWPGVEKLGPFSGVTAKHPSLTSTYHRSPDFCGTCHDVSNPVTGDLAHNNGAQFPLKRGTFSGVLGSALETKAAFNNFPYQYGVVERTYSEFKSSVWPSFSVADYDKLPTELKDGAIKAAYESSAATDFKYEDGSTKNYICQTCHLSSTTGQATSLLHNKPAARKDLPLHNLTGGNYWAPVAIKYMNGKGTLRLGGGLTQAQIESLDDGVERAKANLRQAAKLSVSENEVKVVNLTGHKLISGYPEGRRMWLNVKWYDANNNLLREDGKYGPLSVNLDGRQMAVNTLLDLKGKNTRIYEVHGSMTQRWATQLLDMGVSRDLPLSFDRVSGAVDYTLGDLAKARSGSVRETFHFVLNNNVAKDNRIPPYGMKYSEAKKRNALPVPFCQFGCPSSNGTFEYYDEVELSPPKSAATASIDLVYQPTSWEYIQFLYLANKGGNAFLAEEGANLLDAWLNTGMAEPYVMASATWTRGKNGS